MEAELTYVAKDGTKFKDALQCQQYEERLGVLEGTVAMAKLDLKRLGEEKYICGMLLVEHDGGSCLHTYVTMNIDYKLMDYVNPENASEDNRYIRCKIADVLRDLGKYDDDELCEYFLTHSESIDMTNCGCCHTMNHKLWEHIKNRNETCSTKKY